MHKACESLGVFFEPVTAFATQKDQFPGSTIVTNRSTSITSFMDIYILMLDPLSLIISA